MENIFNYWWSRDEEKWFIGWCESIERKLQEMKIFSHQFFFCFVFLILFCLLWS